MNVIDGANNDDFDYELTYYLAGPMSGLPQYNYPAFSLACKKLRKEDVDVESPHEIEYGAVPGGLPYNDYIVGGLNLLKRCTGIILLPGWATSGGVITELASARSRKLPVYFYIDNPFGLTLVHMGGGR